jgi:hypothetical protein
MEYYSSIKENEIVSFSGKWMEQGTIMLNEIDQTQKDKCCLFSLLCRISIHKYKQNKKKKTKKKHEPKWRTIWEVGTRDKLGG